MDQYQYALEHQKNAMGAPSPVGMPTLKARLELAVNEAESRLAEAKRAREIFNQHPELEELLNIMQRGRF